MTDNTPDQPATIDDYTSAAISALEKGDHKMADALFTERNAIAEGGAVESGAGGGAVEINSADDARDYIRDSGPAGELLCEIWGPYFETELAFAYAFADGMRRNNPGDYEKLLALPDDEAIDKLEELAKRGRAAGLEPMRFNPGAQTQMHTPNEAPAASLSERATAKEELEILLEENPIGSAKYLRPRIQARVRELHTAIHGNASIVGRGLRAV